MVKPRNMGVISDDEYEESIGNNFDFIVFFCLNLFEQVMNRFFFQVFQQLFLKV